MGRDEMRSGSDTECPGDPGTRQQTYDVIEAQLCGEDIQDMKLLALTFELPARAISGDV
jgi:hypothetical protein